MSTGAIPIYSQHGNSSHKDNRYLKLSANKENNYADNKNSDDEFC